MKDQKIAEEIVTWIWADLKGRSGLRSAVEMIHPKIRTEIIDRHTERVQEILDSHNAKPKDPKPTSTTLKVDNVEAKSTSSNIGQKEQSQHSKKEEEAKALAARLANRKGSKS